MTSALFTLRQGEAQVGLQALLGALMKLRDLEIFATKGVHHSDRAQALLRLREDGAFLFLDGGGFGPDPMRKEIDRADDQWHDA